MLACLVTDLQPRSIQAKNVQKYKTRLVDEFQKQGYSVSGVPFAEILYSKVIYIHVGKTNLDVDNLSKPLVDAFSGLIYDDDSTINHRVCSKISFNEIESYELNLAALPSKIAERFEELLDEKSNHIIYYEVGRFSEDMVFVGMTNGNFDWILKGVCHETWS